MLIKIKFLECESVLIKKCAQQTHVMYNYETAIENVDNINLVTKTQT